MEKQGIPQRGVPDSGLWRIGNILMLLTLKTSRGYENTECFDCRFSEKVETISN
jgi:hypothetical protein